jgi:hypothetical protein
MGNISCSICKIDAYKDHNNPVLTIHHLGKYNNYKICANCLSDKQSRSSEKPQISFLNNSQNKETQFEKEKEAK